MGNVRLFNYVDDTFGTSPTQEPPALGQVKMESDYTNKSYSGSMAFACCILILSLAWQASIFSTMSPIVTGIGYFVTGFTLVSLFTKQSDTKATFLLSFALCNLVAVIAQSYSLSKFATPASTLDANTFLKLISSRIDMNLQEMKTIVNAPLAVATWQLLNGIATKTGISGGLWVAVQFNAVLVALSSAVAMEIARLLLGQRSPKLHFGVFLFPLCGMHVLFGAILIRDSFALFFNVIALYSLARYLISPSPFSFVAASLINLVCGTAMYFVREQSIYLYMVFFLLATAVSLLSGKISMGRLAILCIVGAIAIIGSVEMVSTLRSAADETDQKSSSYEGGSQATNRQGSLGYSLIVSQPAPIKAVAGSLYLFVQPIPLWGYFQNGLDEYLWIKGYQGIFAVVIFPSLILGSLLCIRRNKDNNGTTALGRFMVLYLVLSTALVALTSLETRHHGQFFPAYLVLALAGMQPAGNSIITLSWLRISWIATLLLGHVAWWILRL